jgi:predicted outer membrane repeat protein
VNSANVTLNQLSFRNGRGAISDIGENVTSLTVNGGTFTGNTAADGGAISVTLLESLEVKDASFDGNTATDAGVDGGGGGIFTLAQGTQLTGTAVTANRAGGGGGGIYNDGDEFSTVTLAASPVTRSRPDNCAPAGSISGCTG